MTPARAAVLAGEPLSQFLSDISELGIPVVDYPAEELDKELELLD